MKTLLSHLFAAPSGRSHSNGARPSRTGRKLRLEDLEPRRMMARQAVLDFDGESLTAAEMSQGGWNHESGWDKGDLTVSSFKSLFNNSRMNLDLNVDGAVNNADAQIAIDRIVAKVRQDFAPYNLSIVVGDQDDYQHILNDAQTGDVLVMVTGGTDVFTADDNLGLTPWADLGNEHDEISWAFGQAIAGFHIASEFINAAAQTISHEMGHAFGLGHIVETPTGMEEARTHHLMNVDERNFHRDFGFQDVYYRTDVLDPNVAKFSTKHPEFNVARQDAHVYLSHPDVLGTSAGSWVAALQPGALTIHGNNLDNAITVTPTGSNDWTVSIGTKYAVATRRGPSSFWLYNNITLDTSTPDINSINPFAARLNAILIFGHDGADTITVSGAITASTLAHGGAGDDTINGGGGNDSLYGEGGQDTLHGNNGSDHLYGGAGVDHLFGEAGNDHLYGGNLLGSTDDGAVDYLTGGAGRDTFYQRKSFWWSPALRDNILDFVAADDAIEFYS